VHLVGPVFDNEYGIGKDVVWWSHDLLWIQARYYVGGIEGTQGKCRDSMSAALNLNQAPPRERFAVLRAVFLKTSSFLGHYAVSFERIIASSPSAPSSPGRVAEYVRDSMLMPTCSGNAQLGQGST
jgi:hypothetical protein